MVGLLPHLWRNPNDMITYISGGMSGIKNLNAPAFRKAAKSLRKAGHKAISPPEEDKKTFGKKILDMGNQSKMWQDCLKRDLKDLLKCDAIHLLDGWERSKGATLEMMVAKEIGLTFVDARGKIIEEPRGSHESILVESERITNGPRRQAYGHPSTNFSRTAAIWSPILGVPVSAEQVGLCMVGVKLAREINGHTRDNLVDMCGYANTLDMIAQKREDSKIEAMKERANG